MSILRLRSARKSPKFEEIAEVDEGVEEMMSSVSHQGWLTKKGLMMTKKYWCSLYGHLLSFWKNPEENKNSGSSGSLHSPDTIDLSKAQQAMKSLNSKTMFGIDIVINKSRSTLLANDKNDQEQWIRVLQQAMQVKQRLSSFRIVSVTSGGSSEDSSIEATNNTNSMEVEDVHDEIFQPAERKSETLPNPARSTPVIDQSFPNSAPSTPVIDQSFPKPVIPATSNAMNSCDVDSFPTTQTKPTRYEPKTEVEGNKNEMQIHPVPAPRRRTLQGSLSNSTNQDQVSSIITDSTHSPHNEDGILCSPPTPKPRTSVRKCNQTPTLSTANTGQFDEVNNSNGKNDPSADRKENEMPQPVTMRRPSMSTSDSIEVETPGDNDVSEIFREVLSTLEIENDDSDSKSIHDDEDTFGSAPTPGMNGLESLKLLKLPDSIKQLGEMLSHKHETELNSDEFKHDIITERAPNMQRLAKILGLED